MNILEMRYDIKLALHVLLVVDMQPVWSNSNNKELQEQIQLLMRWSMHHGCPIIFLEYRHSANEPTERNTQECLIKLVRDCDYDRYIRIPKRQTRGSDEVILGCTEARYPTSNFLVTGVDADACVLNTVIGLSRLRPQAAIKVVRNACRASKEAINNDESFWQKFNTLSRNVSVCDAVTHASSQGVFL